MGKTINYSRHHDDEWYDEIRLKVVPRYKTSGLSGDEWRVGVLIQFVRKGVILHEDWRHRIEDAVTQLGGLLANASSGGLPQHDKFDNKCFQPGCAEDAITEYRIKQEFSREGYPNPNTGKWSEQRRKFCGRHARRGNAGLEDSDINYEVVSGPGPNARGQQADDESPAVFGGVIDLRSEKKRS